MNKKDNMFYSKETINKIRDIDALTYLLNEEPDNLVKDSRTTYSTKEHDSLKLSNGMWYWFSRGIGGKSAIDYLMIVKEKSFKEAVEILLDIDNISIPNHYDNNQLDKLVLPQRNSNNDTVIRYLLNRKIDKDIIKECIDKNIIYEDINHNVVFLGLDKNSIERYAFIRGTGDKRYLKEAYGSHKAFSFKLENNKSDSLHLFESAIDLLSYATIHKKDYFEYNLLSLAGVYTPNKDINKSKIPLALNYYLFNNQNIKNIYLHLDNDYVGRNSTIALTNLLKDKYNIIDEPAKMGKDYNDYLINISRERKIIER